MTAMPAVKPGELLLEEFLKPNGLTQYRLAKEIGVPAQRIGDIVHGKRAIIADTDLRLCRFFSLSKGYWLCAQAAHDMEVTEQRIGRELAAITPLANQKLIHLGGTQPGAKAGPRRRPNQ